MANEVQEVVRDGGVYTIAGAIVFAAVKCGPMLARVVNILYAIWEQREVKLEQEHRRDRRRRRSDSSMPPTRASKMPSVDATPSLIEFESTDVYDIRDDVRRRSPGLRPPRKGTQADKPYDHDKEG